VYGFTNRLCGGRLRIAHKLGQTVHIPVELMFQRLYVGLWEREARVGMQWHFTAVGCTVGGSGC